MRVVVAGWLLGLGPSGANRRLLGLLRALPRQLQGGESITVLHGPEGVPEEAPDGVSWCQVDIPPVPAWKRALHQQKQLPRLLRELAADVFEQGFLPVVANAPCPVCVTLHDLRDLGPFARRNRWVAGVAHRRSLGRAAAVVVPSQFTAHELHARLGRRPAHVEVLPGGVGREFLDYPRQVSDQPYLLHVGHLERRKNLDMLLEAYGRFVGRHVGDTVPALVCVGADAGEGRRLAQQAARLRIGGQVRFPGRVSETRLMEHYAGCRALLFPSFYEGFGIPALEALAMGKPVFVSDRGALAEVVGAAGTVLPAADVDAWAKAMAQVMEPRNDDDRVTRLRRARARQLSWEVCAAGTLALWRRLADQAVRQVAEGTGNG